MVDAALTHDIKIDYDVCKTETKFRVGKVTMFSGIGTHMDAPAHCIKGGKTIDQIPLENLIKPCVVIDVSTKAHENYIIDLSDIKHFEEENGVISNGTFVCFHTGWCQFWGEKDRYHNNYTFPTIHKDVAHLLLDRNISGIGIDTLSPDNESQGFPVHRAFLSAEKYIVENVDRANRLPKTGAHIFVVPIKMSGCTESPVRLIGAY